LLAVGTIAVSEAHGVYPDGTQFNIPEDDDPPEPWSVPRDTKKSTVYLAIVKSGSDTKNCFRLLIGPKRKDQGSRLGVVRVKELRDDNTVLLDEEYIPTVINCQAAPALIRLAGELLGLLHYRGEALAGRAGTARDKSLANVADFLMLQMINRYEPLLDYLLSLQVLHPEALYRLAIELVGELSTFTTERKRPPLLPTYGHDNLQETFRPVIQELRQSLSMVMEQSAVSIPLNPRKYGVMTAYFPQALIDTGRLILAVKGSPSAEVLRQQVPQHIKIGPLEQIVQIVNTALPGLRIRALAVAPRQVPYSSGYAYFEFDQHSHWFTTIKESGALALHLGADFSDMDVQLWAVRSSYHFDPFPHASCTPEPFVPVASRQPQESKPPDDDDSRTVTDWDKESDSTPSVDDVQFTVYRPTAVKPLEWYTLLAFTHRSTLPADAAPDALQPIEEVERQASNVLGCSLRNIRP
jgi:type VI secretion system protein ImpJ